MDANLVDAIDSSDFNAEKYVRDLSKRCVGGQELQQQRKTIQSLLEVTNVALKRNVYRNYTQFIETAREFGHLETEMYQLGNLLTDQKILLDAIQSSNIHSEYDPTLLLHKEMKQKTDEEVKKGEDEENRRRKFTEIIEKVEGCPGLLENKDRKFLYEGDLIEIDSVENTPVQKVHAYLFSDSLMLTSWMSNRRGPVRFKMFAMHDLTSLAVVNVRDLGPIKFAFKILGDSDTRLFQCSNANYKKEWMDSLDQAKKQQMTREKKLNTSLSESSRSPSAEANAESPTTPWIESDYKMTQVRHPDWLYDSPDDLDVFIAERHFESALELLIKVKEYLSDFLDTSDSQVLDIRNKTDVRRKNLISVLIKELEVTPDKSLQGGLRAARRLVKLLNALDRQTQACELMLQLCTCLMKKQLRLVKREGSPQIYVKQLGHQFYSTLIDVVEEFTRIFPPASIATLVVWTQQQLHYFLTTFICKNVLFGQQTTTNLSVVADCIAVLRKQNQQICDCGLDLRYQLEGALYKPVSTVLHDARDKAHDAAKHRISEEKWIPFNLESESSLRKVLAELEDIGVSIPSTYIRDCSLELTTNTIAFIKLFISLLDDCCKLYVQNLEDTVETTLYDVLRGQLTLMETALKSHNKEIEVQIIRKNGVFILDHMTEIAQNKFQQCSGHHSGKLNKFAKDFQTFRGGVMRPTPKPRQNIPKYTSEEYI